MKLELKHIAPYLPYGLNTKFNLQDVVPYKLAKEDIRDKKLMAENVEFVLEHCKPILRPLSDLQGKGYLNALNFIHPDYNVYEENNDYFIEDRSNLNMMELMTSRVFTQYLFENHFDVFGLIEKDLAIDINTLNK